MKSSARGFTLIELLIASTIFVVIATSIYSAFQSGIFGYRNIGAAIETAQAASFIFDRLNLELRNAFAYSKDKAGFTGYNAGMSFYSIVGSFYDNKEAQDYAFISYELKDGKLLRTCYKNMDTIVKGPEIQPQELPGNVDSLTLDYAYIDKDNKIAWQNSWPSQQGQDAGQNKEKQLPIAVKINLKLKNNPEDYPRIRSSWAEEFERTVYLPLADLNVS